MHENYYLYAVVALNFIPSAYSITFAFILPSNIIYKKLGKYNDLLAKFNNDKQQ